MLSFRRNGVSFATIQVKIIQGKEKGVQQLHQSLTFQRIHSPFSEQEITTTTRKLAHSFCWIVSFPSFIK